MQPPLPESCHVATQRSNPLQHSGRPWRSSKTSDEEEVVWPGGVGNRPKGNPLAVGKGMWGPKEQEAEHRVSSGMGETLGGPGQAGLGYARPPPP